MSNIHRSGEGSRLGTGAPPSINANLSKAVRDKDREINTLREQATQLQNTLAQGDGQAKMLNKELQKMKLQAGLTEVTGPGIILTLSDSKTGPPSNRMFEKENYIIHDWTIQRAINEMNAAQAEAISINGQRVTSRTAIRCVGPTALVNNVALSSPFEIRAIGDPNTLASALNIPDGYMDSLRSYDPAMARLEKKSKLVIPAYTGSTDSRFAKPVGERKTASDNDKEKAG